MPAFEKGGHRQHFRPGHHALAAAAMDANLEHLFPFLRENSAPKRMNETLNRFIMEAPERGVDLALIGGR